jgi:tetratricopeptide (TPR) repeat protein
MSTSPFNDITAGLLWGKGIRKDRIIPKQDLVKVQRLIDSPAMLKDKLDDMLPILRKAVADSDNSPEVKKVVDDVDQAFRNMIKLLIKAGLWPTFSAQDFMDFVNDAVGEKKFAASETVIHNFERWVELFPRIITVANRTLSNFKDPHAQNEFYRIVHDVVFGPDGIFTIVERARRILEDTEVDPDKKMDDQKDTIKSDLPISALAERVKWFHTEGLLKIRKALASVFARKSENEDTKDQVFRAARTIEDNTFIKEWVSRVSKALEQHGFGLNGAFDPKKFEKTQRDYESLAKMADGFRNVPEEMAKAYESYTKALEHYKDDPKKRDEVVDSYYHIVLHGKRNMYQAFADAHSQVKNLNPESLPIQPSNKTPEATQEVPPVSPEKTEGAPKQEAPVENKQETKVDAPKTPVEKGKGDAVPSDSGEDAEDPFEGAGVAEYMVGKGIPDFVKAAVEVFKKRELLQRNHEIAVSPRVSEILDGRLDRFARDFEGMFIVPDKYMKSISTLEKNIQSKGTTLNALTRYLYGLNNGYDSAEGVRSLSPSAMNKELEETFKWVTKEEKTKATKEPKAETKAPAKGKGKEKGKKEAPEAVIGTLEKVKNETPPAQEVTPENKEVVQEAINTLTEVVEEKEKAVEETQPVLESADQVIDNALKRLDNDNETGDNALEYTIKVMESLKRSMEGDTTDPQMKDAVVTHLDSLMTRVNKALQGGVSTPEDKAKAKEILERYKGVFKEANKDFEEQVGVLRDHLKVLENTIASGEITGATVKSGILPGALGIIKSIGVTTPTQEEGSKTPTSEESIPEEVENPATSEPEGTSSKGEEPVTEEAKPKAEGTQGVEEDVETPQAISIKEVNDLKSALLKKLLGPKSSTKEIIQRVDSVLNPRGEESYLDYLYDPDLVDEVRQTLTTKSIQRLTSLLNKENISEEELATVVGPFLEGMKKFMKDWLKDSEGDVEKIDKLLESLPTAESVRNANSFFVRKASEEGKSKIVTAAMLQFFTRKK